MNKLRLSPRGVVPSAVFLLMLLTSRHVYAHGSTPLPLRGVAVPVSAGLLDGQNPIVVDKTAAIQLGKALFWDSAVGSDGMACASCHFHAGSDSRSQNQLATGELHKTPSGKTFQATASGGAGGVNYNLKLSDFPLHQFSNPKDKKSAVVFTTDDVVSSAGAFTQKFTRLNASGSGIDDCKP